MSYLFSKDLFSCRSVYVLLYESVDVLFKFFRPPSFRNPQPWVPVDLLSHEKVLQKRPIRALLVIEDGEWNLFVFRKFWRTPVGENKRSKVNKR